MLMAADARCPGCLSHACSMLLILLRILTRCLDTLLYPTAFHYQKFITQPLTRTSLGLILTTTYMFRHSY